MYSALCVCLLFATACFNPHAIHVLCIWLSNPNLWHDVLAQTPARVIAISGFISVAVQLLKKVAPNAINGRSTLAVNLSLSVAGVFVGMNPANFWTETTLLQVLAVFTTASGIHGVGRGLFDGTSKDPQDVPNPKPVQMIGNMLILLSMLGLAAVLTGCVHQAQPTTAPALPIGAADATDAEANRVLQTIQDFMTPIVRDIQNGKLKASPGQRAAINQLDGYYNKAATAEVTYHNCMFTTAAAQQAETPRAVNCLTTAGLTGALADAKGAFNRAQTALASSAKN